MKKLENVKVVSFKDYRRAAMRTCKDSSMNNTYMSLEIVSEVGEVVGKLAKAVRDDAAEVTEKRKQEIIAELGDVMWGIAGIVTVNKGLLTPFSEGDICDFDIAVGVKYKVRDTGTTYNRALVLATYAGDFAQAVLFKENIATRLEAIMVTVTILAHELGTTLLQVCQRNIDKLTDRFNRNVIGGSGDYR